MFSFRQAPPIPTDHRPITSVQDAMASPQSNGVLKAWVGGWPEERKDRQKLSNVNEECDGDGDDDEADECKCK